MIRLDAYRKYGNRNSNINKVQLDEIYREAVEYINYNDLNMELLDDYCIDKKYRSNTNESVIGTAAIFAAAIAVVAAIIAAVIKFFNKVFDSISNEVIKIPSKYLGGLNWDDISKGVIVAIGYSKDIDNMELEDIQTTGYGKNINLKYVKVKVNATKYQLVGLVPMVIENSAKLLDDLDRNSAVISGTLIDKKSEYYSKNMPNKDIYANLIKTENISTNEDVHYYVGKKLGLDGAYSANGVGLEKLADDLDAYSRDMCIKTCKNKEKQIINDLQKFKKILEKDKANASNIDKQNANQACANIEKICTGVSNICNNVLSYVSLTFSHNVKFYNTLIKKITTKLKTDDIGFYTVEDM